MGCLSRWGEGKQGGLSGGYDISVRHCLEARIGSLRPSRGKVRDTERRESSSSNSSSEREVEVSRGQACGDCHPLQLGPRSFLMSLGLGVGWVNFGDLA